MDFINKILQGDSREVLKQLPAGTFNCCVTSPPYFGLRDYGVEGQIGLEGSIDDYVGNLVAVFREIRRVLRDDGTLWLNLGDSYAGTRGRQPPPTNTRNKSGHTPGNGIPRGLKPKDLIGVPWRVAFALQADGWYLRSDIVWNKPNAMPESVRDRPTRAHEYIFLLAKSELYYYDYAAVKEPAVSDHSSGNGFKRPERVSHAGIGDRASAKPWEKTDLRNKRSVWNVSTKPFKAAHFAVFPSELIKPCILAGCPEGGIVVDPFMGSGTTGATALELGRKFTGIDLNPQYITEIAEPRIADHLKNFTRTVIHK